MNLEKPDFSQYIEKLSSASGVSIKKAADVLTALSQRLDEFGSLGCKASDHGLDYVMYNPATEAQVESIFQKGLANEPLTTDEIEKYKTYVLVFLGRQYAKRNWVMQLHYGAIRNVNTAMFNKLGPDTGYDCISTYGNPTGIVQFLDSLNKTNELPKTVVYSLNHGDNEMLDSMVTCFEGPEAAGKIQHGAAWWFNDTKTGMQKHMADLANIFVLGNFIGMLTDSRSFLSYTRHEYFRRILCNQLGIWVENGEYPNDIKALGKMVQDISYNNTLNYFGFKL